MEIDIIILLMKAILKCYFYFGSILVLCVLGLVNYLMTRHLNGFERAKSVNLDVQKFYCSAEIYMYEQCEN